MVASDDVVFAWAIGKALLIVIVSFGTLVYAAWVVTYPRKKRAALVGIAKDGILKYKSSVESDKSLLPANEAEAEGARRILASTSTEEISDHVRDNPTAAA